MNQTPTAPNGLTIPAAAARAGVNETTLREAISRGQIPTASRQVLVVHPADVDRWAERRTS